MSKKASGSFSGAALGCSVRTDSNSVVAGTGLYVGVLPVNHAKRLSQNVGVLTQQRITQSRVFAHDACIDLHIVII